MVTMTSSTDGMAVERLGLTLVHPAGGESKEFKATANIIFVHGLRGHPLKTWSYTKQAAFEPGPEAPRNVVDNLSIASKRHVFSKIKLKLKPSSSDKRSATGSSSINSDKEHVTRVFWPADVLPEKVPNAKIWTYGYNSGVVGGLFQANNQNSILQHGNDLMVKVVREISDENPIIFVAHSLGGLLVKVALNSMSKSVDKRSSQTFDRVKAVVFCGTPHRGSNAAAWGRLASNLVSAAFTDSNSKLLAELQVNAEVLGPIQEDFLKLLHQFGIRVHSFQEGRPSSGIKGLNEKVVYDISSTCGWSLETVETIDADHRQMVKQPGTEVICDVLRDIHGLVLDEVKEKDKKAKQKKQQDDDDYDRPYIYLNRFYTVDYHLFLSNIPQRHPNTCTWLLDTNPVGRWRSGDGPNILWLRGYPGLGKSVLARYLVEELKSGKATPQSQPRKSAIMTFFFCSYRDEKAKTDHSLVCSLIHQLVYLNPRLSRAISRKFFVIDRSVTENMKVLWDLLLDVIDAIEDDTLYIVIDALDELTSSLREPFLTEFFSLLSKTTTTVKVVITSRAEPDIEKALGPESVQLDLSKEKKNGSDVSVYLKDTVFSYGEENGFGEEMSKKILEELVSRADSMFLWAKLAWAYFTDGVGSWTTSLVKQKLEELQRLPPGMDVLYHRILTAVDKRVRLELLQAFQWIVVAARPLTVSEISVAMGLQHRPRRAENIEVRLNMQAFFKKMCPHLVRVDESGVITLVHQSFKDFLLQTAEVSSGPDQVVPNEFFIKLDVASYNSGLDCLGYLGMTDFENWEPLWTRTTYSHSVRDDISPVLPFLDYARKNYLREDIFRAFPFLDYARKNWALHLHNMDYSDEAWSFFYATLDKRQKMRWEPSDPLIFYLVRMNLRGLLRLAFKEGLDMNQLNSSGEHIIHVAVRDINKTDFTDVLFLLDLGADVNGRDAHGRTLLHRLTTNENVEGIRQWVDIAFVDINAQNYKGETVLHAAVRAGDFAVDILDILLSHPEIDVNISDHEGRTPLCLATHWAKYRATVRLLQCSNGDVSKSSQDGENPLINAIIQGWSDVALDIMERLDTVNSFRDNVGRSILHWAAYMNMPDVFRAALDKQTTLLNYFNNRRWTPLHSVADDGNDELVQVLLARGASTTLKTRSGETALHLAATKGHFHVVRLLVQSMPDWAVNAKDNNGWTALHRSLSSGRDDMTTWLLEQSAIDTGLRDKHGRKPIMFASAFASNDMLRAFLRHSPEDVLHVDSFKYDLLHMAAFYGNRPNVEFLLSYDHLDQASENHWGKRALDLAPTEGFGAILIELGFTNSSRHLEQLAIVRKQGIGRDPYSNLKMRSGSEWAIQSADWQ